MNIEQVSTAAGGHNEDLVSVFRGEHCTDIVIIDGGTSVAKRDYIDPDGSDVVWFVTQFSAALRQSIRAGRSQDDSVAMAADAMRSQFVPRAQAASMPLYAYPIAAMTWVRVTEHDAGATLDLYCLGDCKAILRRPDGQVVDLDPFSNPQELVLQGEMDRLKRAGVTDPAQRLAALMPMLRSRRESQHAAPAPQVLCPAPRGPFQARRTTAQAEPGSMLLAMTDGFSRIYDTYHLRCLDSLVQWCLHEGLAPALASLRAFEADGGDTGQQSVKRADDASAVRCIFGAG
ncbi:hypothetical protein CR105_10595 [Massilia eurypsychrophila]|uniref:PPM-type phosphatase domain-containing protein n=1 Tax=Massilia eurypsychrophila TaxID=1485217 RepID=A0A2G8TFU1_9BURK|nr:protein phosphatase 2C domain-containing protein [Massilia eurypsychrophila]PIL44920.1 hypothetical protein CR105_10595 [Massilia eurypsychrophila]